HWLVWNEKANELRSIKAEDPRYRHRELYTADRIREYIQSAMGELSSDDERPEMLAAQQGDSAETAAEALNQLAAYAWDHEWAGDSVMLRLRRIVLDLGYAAVRCRWDQEAGPEKQQPQYAPLSPEGSPLPPDQTMMLAQNGAMPDGSLPKFKKIGREGRTVWEVYSPFQILTPPGVVHEDEFAWEILRRPVPIEEIQAVYGIKVSEDTDIVSGVGVPSSLGTVSGNRSSNRLRDHAWVYTCFDRATAASPTGGETILGGGNYDVLDHSDTLEYEHGGKPHTGVVYFHWWRLSDRFQSRSFVEPLKDPQRIINRRETQNVELIDRSMPKLIVRKGDWPDTTTGDPLEIVELERNAQAPQPTALPQPGTWMYADKQSHDENLSHASTLSPLRLGENPAAVQTYGQLALLNDNEHGKRSTIQMEHSAAKAILVELSVGDIKKYWPDEKQGMIFGEQDQMQAVTFRKSDIPAEFRVKVAKGQPLPRSQGAEVKKIDSIFAAAVQAGATAADPMAWASWYKRSIEAGAAQALPTQSPSSQQQLAEMENQLMRSGVDSVPANYDQLVEHLPIHRAAQDQARAAGDATLSGRIERHIQAHLLIEQQNAAQQAALAPSGVAGPSDATGPQQPAGPQNGGPQQGGQQQGGGGQIPAFAPKDFAALSTGR
ncbi:MAG TPA: hypothetical protein VNN79_14295, partial [Actinomycetota bacterium]|nr:hypothetical protein [Actinomycetota bacterium]